MLAFRNQYRQAELGRTPTHLTAHRLHIPLWIWAVGRYRSVGRWGVFTDGSLGQALNKPIKWLILSHYSVSVLYKLKLFKILAVLFMGLLAVPVSFTPPKFLLKFATQSSEFEWVDTSRSSFSH